MTLTYIASLAKVKVDLHAEDEGRRSNVSAVRAQTNRRTDGRYKFYNLPASLKPGFDEFSWYSGFFRYSRQDLICEGFRIFWIGVNDFPNILDFPNIPDFICPGIKWGDI